MSHTWHPLPLVLSKYYSMNDCDCKSQENEVKNNRRLNWRGAIKSTLPKEKWKEEVHQFFSFERKGQMKNALQSMGGHRSIDNRYGEWSKKGRRESKRQTLPKDFGLNTDCQCYHLQHRKLQWREQSVRREINRKSAAVMIAQAISYRKEQNIHREWALIVIDVLFNWQK